MVLVQMFPLMYRRNGTDGGIMTMAARNGSGAREAPDENLIRVSANAKARLRDLGWSDEKIEATLRKPARPQLRPKML